MRIFVFLQHETSGCPAPGELVRTEEGFLGIQFLIDLAPEEIILEPIDADAINSFVREIITK